MAEFRTPVVIGTILNPVPITGTVTAAPPTYIGTIADIGTLGTLQSPIAVAGGTISTVQSLSNIAVASLVGSVGALANLAVASLVGSIGSPVAIAGGTISTVQSLSNIAVASLVGSVGALANIAVASLVGSIGSPVAIAGGTIGTISAIVAALDMGQFVLSTLLNGATLVPGISASTLLAATLQDMVVDVTYGTAYPATGSIQTFVTGVDAVTNLQNGSIVGGPWFSGTIPAAHRITTSGPLGWKVAVVSTVVGTVAAVYVSAGQSFTD